MSRDRVGRILAHTRPTPERNPVTIRWIFAVLAILCGVFVLFKASGSDVLIAAGLGIIFAGIEGVTP